MSDILHLHELPHRQARQHLERGSTVFFSIDPIEFHGPHLSLRNDHLISTGLSLRIAKPLQARMNEDGPILLASTFDIGVDPTPGPGTRAVPFRRLCKLVVDACEALADLGAQRVVLMTFHGTPLHSIALHRGTKVLLARGRRCVAPLNLLMSDVATAPVAPFAASLDHIAEPERSEMLASLRHDVHAGFMETSFALALAPHAVDPLYKTLPDCPLITPDAALMRAARVAAKMGQEKLADELRVAAWGVGWSKLRPFPGYTGRPRHATPESGEVFVRYAAQRAVDAAVDVFRGAEPPGPPMPWMEALTMQGRIPGIDIPLDAVAAD